MNIGLSRIRDLGALSLCVLSLGIICLESVSFRSSVNATPCEEAVKTERGRFVLKDRAWVYDQGPTDWIDQHLISVDVECDLPQCDSEYIYLLKKTLHLPLHVPLTQELLNKAWSHLMQTGLFHRNSYVIFAQVSPQKNSFQSTIISDTPPPSQTQAQPKNAQSQQKSALDPQANTAEAHTAEAHTAEAHTAEAHTTKTHTTKTHTTKTHASTTPETLERHHTKKGVIVRFCARGYAVIKELKITYTDSKFYPKQFRGEIRKRLSLKKGGIFPKDPKFTRVQENKVLTSYARLGYQGTKVKVIPRYLDKEGKLVSVEVQINEGERPPIGLPLVKSDSYVSYSEVAKVIIPDSFYDFWPSLFSWINIGTYDRKTIRENANELETRMRKDGWVSARVKVLKKVPDPNNDKGEKTVRPQIQIDRGPKVKVRFVGNRALTHQELSQELTFIRSGAFDDVELEQSRLNLINRYKSIAHYYAEIRSRIKEISTRDGQGEKDGQEREEREKRGSEFEVIFFIDEGPLVYIEDISISGAQQIPVEDLKSIMKTKGISSDGVIYTLSSSSGILQEAKLNQDLKNILQYYHSEGFSHMSFRCSDPNRETRTQWSERISSSKKRFGAFDIWSTQINQHHCFQVISDSSDRNRRQFLKIKIEINEGAKTSVNRVDINAYLQGMDERTKEDGLQLLRTMNFLDILERPQFKAGLSQKKIEGLSRFLRRHFRKSGYLKAKVQPLCQQKDKSTALTPALPCQLDQLYGETVQRLSFSVDLGPRAQVEGVLLRGLLLTRPEVIKRELLLQSGMPLSTEDLFLSQTKLRSLGLFRSVKIESIGLGEAPKGSLIEPVTLVISVEETPPIEIDYLLLGLKLRNRNIINFGNHLGLFVFTNLTGSHKNLLGRGWEIGLGGDYGQTVYQWTPNDQQPLEDEVAYKVGTFFKNPRFLNHLQLSLQTDYEQKLSDDYTFYLRQIVTNTTLSYDFYHSSVSEQWRKGLRLDLIGQATWESRKILYLNGEQRDYGPFQDSFSLTPKLTYDQRDNPIHPTRGFYLSSSFKILKSFEDLTNLDKETSYKWTIKSQWVTSILKRQLIFANSFKFGIAKSRYTDLTIPLEEELLFRAGGDQVSYSVRGYPENGIDACRGKETADGLCSQLYDVNDFTQSTPRLVSGFSIINVNLEARFPTFLIPNLWGAIFNDWGVVSTQLSELSLDDFYPSWGVGLRLLVTGQIPIRVDIARPLRQIGFEPSSWNYSVSIFYTL